MYRNLRYRVNPTVEVTGNPSDWLERALTALPRTFQHALKYAFQNLIRAFCTR